MRTLISSWSSGLRLHRADPQLEQNAFSIALLGPVVLDKLRRRSRRWNEPLATRALTEAEPPVRRWQRVQWQ